LRQIKRAAGLIFACREIDNILVMRLDRPSVRNALNREALRLLAENYTRLARSETLRGIDAAADRVRTEGRHIALTEDAREGMMSMIQKRKPVFARR
jgi:enoyl-CoA hydratase/carnithine racemase